MIHRSASPIKHLALLLILALWAPSGHAADRPMNVVVILADDLGWSDLGCYGADLHETPAIDRFARTALRFTDAYAASICSPTRACLMTGKHYARLGMTIWREGSLRNVTDQRLIPPPSVSDLAHDEETIAEIFQAAGYLTAIVGKWHLGDAPHYPETHGFDINVGGTLWGAPQTYFFPYKGTGRFGGEFRYVPHLEGGAEGEYLTDRLTDEALHVIDRAGDQPFFLYLAHHAPHTPIEAKPDAIQRFQRKLEPSMHHQNPAFAAMIESIDESVARVLAKLEERHLSDRTVVVFASDNGGFIGSSEGQRVTNNHPLRSGKGSLYEGGIRVPLMVHWPSVTTAGKTCHQPVFLADLFPTLVEITGLARSSDQPIDGLSLTSQLKDPGTPLERDALYFHYPHYYQTTTPAGAIRSGDWKLIEYFENDKLELYNLKEDLGESTNRADSESAVTQRLHAKLINWRQSVGARLPTTNPDFRSP